MFDAIYVLVTIGFFVLCAVFGLALQRVGSDDQQPGGSRP